MKRVYLFITNFEIIFMSTLPISRQIAVLNRFNTIHEKMYNHLITKVSHLFAFSIMQFTLRKAVKLFPIGACTFKRKLKVLFPWVASAEVWFKLLHRKNIGWQEPVL